MNCFDEKKLYEYFDNILFSKEKKEIEDHLKICAICQKKVEELKSFEKDLERFWKEFRKKCPSPEEMYEFSLGRLGKEDTEKISKHLKLCHICKMKHEESEKIAEEFEMLAKAGVKEEIYEPLISEKEKGILQKMAGALNIAERSKALADSFERLWRAQFAFSRPIGLKTLAPCFETTYVADVGEGYEKEVIQQEDNPFQVEISQFGKQISIILRTGAEFLKNSIVRFKLYEKERAKYSGILFVSDGIGKYTINLGEKDLKRPEEEPYKIKLDVLSSLDILSDIKDPSSSKILMELMKTGNAEAVKMVTDIIEKRGKTKNKQLHD